MRPETIQAAANQLQNILIGTVAALGFSGKHTPTVSIDGSGDEAMVVLDGGVYVAPFWAKVEAKVIGGKKTRKEIQYQLQVILHDPGVRYYKDGSGQPPSDDIVDKGEPVANPFRAANEALSLLLSQRIDSFLEGLAEEMQYQEDKKAGYFQD